MGTGVWSTRWDRTGIWGDQRLGKRLGAVQGRMGCQVAGALGSEGLLKGFWRPKDVQEGPKMYSIFKGLLAAKMRPKTYSSYANYSLRVIPTILGDFAGHWGYARVILRGCGLRKAVFGMEH